MTPMGRRDIQVSDVQDNFFAIGRSNSPFANVTLQTKSLSLYISYVRKTTFNPEITKNLMFEKCDFCEKEL